MKSICVLMSVFLVVLFAFCATAMSNTVIELDGEVLVASTGPPMLGVLAMGETQTCDDQDRVEAINLVYFIDDAIAAERDLQTENEYVYNANSERSGRLLWFNYAGAPLHCWVQA